MSCIELPECLRERFPPVSSLAGALHRSRDGELHADVEVAWVFIGHKAWTAGGYQRKTRPDRKENEPAHHERAPCELPRGTSAQTIGTAFPIAIERVKKFPERFRGACGRLPLILVG